MTVLISALHTYPIKGCRRVDHDAARVQPWGLAGDRRWMLVDENGVGVTQREVSAIVRIHPVVTPAGLTLRATGSPDLTVAEPLDGEPVQIRVFSSRNPTPARAAGGPADDWLTDLLGHRVRLVWQAEPAPLEPQRNLRRDSDRVSFADGYPVLVANTASLDAVNDWLVEAGDEPVPMTRFRPNIVVSGAAPWAEDDWVGRRLRLGSVLLRAARPCDRCVVTTTDQETGERGRQPLFVLGRYRRRPEGLLFGLNLIPDGVGEIRVGDPVTVL